MNQVQFKECSDNICNGNEEKKKEDIQESTRPNRDSTILHHTSLRKALILTVLFCVALCV